MAKNRKTPDMNLPMWFDGQNINEALFCEEFLQERRIIFANGAFFTPDGRVTDDLPLRGEIYDKLKFCAVNNIPRKITNILEVLKLEAQVPDFPPEQDRIHLSNGTLLLNGTFTEGRPAIVRSRLPVAYNPDATAPVIWLNFLDGLLYVEDIPTLQEFIGYGRGLCDVVPLGGMNEKFTLNWLRCFKNAFIKKATGTTLVYFQIFVQDHQFAVAFNDTRLNHDDFQTFLQFQIL